MIRKIAFPAMLLALGYALWVSADFVQIAAGVSLFMFGMFCLEEGFKFFTGGPLESILRVSTDRLWKCLAFGALTTTLMQSSSLVSLITVSFVGADMISLAAGIGVIMGANIGTTTGAWLIAGLGLKVDIAAYAMPVLVFGAVLHMQRDKTLRALGYVLLGFAFLFLGIHYMKAGFEAFQNSFDLSTWGISGLLGVLVYTGVGIAVTVVMQSSHATLLIIIAALAAGQVSYENALALAIGANLGSTVTIVLGSFSSNIGGKRLAASHVLFNLATAIFAILFINQLAMLVDFLASMFGIAPDAHLLKLALFHTLFNVIGVLGLSPFIRPLEALLIRRITFQSRGTEYPRYLFKEALETPATVVNAVGKEVEHLLENAFGLLAHGLSLSRSTIDGDEPLQPIVRQTRRIFPIDVDDAYEEKIKGLHNEIVSFIAEAQTRETTRAATQRLYELRGASQGIVEAVKGMKHLHKNLRRHGLSTNHAVRERYDDLRLQLAQLLRESRHILGEQAEDLTMLSVDALKLSQEKSSRKISDDLDEMIRQRRIPTTVATSIMNDEDYASGIAEKLLEAIRMLRRPHGLEAADSLALSKEDIDQLLSKD